MSEHPQDTCPFCYGSGKLHPDLNKGRWPCKNCHGTGKVPAPPLAQREPVLCPNCKGAGMSSDDYHTPATCYLCDGSGKLPPGTLIGAASGEIEQEEAEQLAMLFHSTYERLAPEHDYKTSDETAKPWRDVPEQNRRLMIATCLEILAWHNEAKYQYAAKVLQELPVEEKGAGLPSHVRVDEVDAAIAREQERGVKQ